MKTLPVLLLLVMLSACKDRGENIEGTYVRTFQNEYAFGVDTITIERIGHEDTYLVHKNSGYKRILNGRVTEQAEYSHTRWLALFDEKTELLTNDFERQVIWFQGSGKTIRLGKSIYTKDIK